VRRVTVIVSIVVLAFLVVYDVVAYIGWGSSSTLSMLWMPFLMRHPWALFAAGFLCGHIAWPQFRRAT